MNKIVSKENIAPDIVKLVIESPIIAQKAHAGQFVVVIIDEKGERIPLTLADWDHSQGTITLLFQRIGFTTKKLSTFGVGDCLAHVLGPLGHPTRIEKLGEIYCIAGGVGIAEVFPVARAFKHAGNRVTGIMGARSKELLILETPLRQICDELFITSDDGSYGTHGLVTDVLKDLFGVIEKSTHTKYPQLVYCIGPVLMMQAVSEITQSYGVKTRVSLNPIMVDATGMCGACRCTVDGKTVFGCVDGPDFDAHQVDFQELNKRLHAFKNEERNIDL
ncbi:MAG: sulfide/dihydroorotate dehydrogenase-like FAD/NAD-binding protein [Candidatus Omnitrophica bacterium]|nr:sulfide/dihydroorotate dehydrogenase-like FAD/NAD-binding protein [Candidatus Omnitrophota bacterium]